MAEPIPIPPSQAVTLTALLIPLFRISGLIVTLGIVFCVDALTRAFFGTVSGAVGWIPYLNRVVQSPLHTIEHKVSSFLGGLESHIDASMGWYVHALAINVGRLADGSAEAGWVAWALAKALHGVRVAVHALPHIGSVVTKTNAVTKIVKQTITRVEHVTKIATHAAPAYVARQVGALAGELEGVIGRDIPNLRDQVKAAEDSAIRAWKWIRQHKTLVGSSAGTAAVAWALARLGISWTRCSNWKRVGKEVCGTPFGDIEGFLAIALGAAAIADFRDLVKLAQQVEHATAEGIKDLAQV